MDHAEKPRGGAFLLKSVSNMSHNMLLYLRFCYFF